MQANASTGSGRVAPSPATDTNAPTAAPVSPAAIRRPPLLGLIVFCGGFASLGAELATSRLVAPYFGSSTFIWATAPISRGRGSRKTPPAKAARRHRAA